MGLSRDFWGGRRVLVTGHTGFKGSWVSLWLISLGAEVVGYSIGVPTKPSLFELASVEERLTHVEGDVRDGRRLAQVVGRHRPEVVVHMAAQSLVRRSYLQPVETFETNVIGTVNILEAARTGGVRVVVNVTSDKCYADTGSGPYREGDAKGGSDPYSASKACAEIVSDGYRTAFFANHGPALASVRAGNVIGGGDWGEDRLVGDIMVAALERRPVLIRNPGAVRPWQHVLNPLEGYLLLAERLWDDRTWADGWNFGPDEADERPVRAVVERIAELWGEGLAWAQDERKQPHETDVLRLDSSRARERLGWVPRWDLEQAIESVVTWYRAYQAGEDMQVVVLDQIRAFESERSIPSPAA
ncbi:MAG: CDP-glucose 4,6-dehydratase [Gaiellaceae bacterium]